MKIRITTSVQKCKKKYLTVMAKIKWIYGDGLQISKKNYSWPD
jgi:hypothetical protein